jgi:hypothetical protein
MSDEPKHHHLGAEIITRTKVHALADPPTAERLTLCGIGAGPGPLGLTGEPADVNCRACRELLGL